MDDVVKNTQFIALYFTINGCKPCARLSPFLRKLYVELRDKKNSRFEKGKDSVGNVLEVLMVSPDAHTSTFQTTYSDVPWYMMDGQSPLHSLLMDRFLITTFPSLLLFNCQTGGFINSTAHFDIMNFLPESVSYDGKFLSNEDLEKALTNASESFPWAKPLTFLPIPCEEEMAAIEEARENLRVSSSRPLLQISLPFSLYEKLALSSVSKPDKPKPPKSAKPAVGIVGFADFGSKKSFDSTQICDKVDLSFTPAFQSSISLPIFPSFSRSTPEILEETQLYSRTTNSVSSSYPVLSSLVEISDGKTSNSALFRSFCRISGLNQSLQLIEIPVCSGISSTSSLHTSVPATNEPTRTPSGFILLPYPLSPELYSGKNVKQSLNSSLSHTVVAYGVVSSSIDALSPSSSSLELYKFIFVVEKSTNDVPNQGAMPLWSSVSMNYEIILSTSIVGGKVSSIAQLPFGPLVITTSDSVSRIYTLIPSSLSSPMRFNVTNSIISPRRNRTPQMCVLTHNDGRTLGELMNEISIITHFEELKKTLSGLNSDVIFSQTQSHTLKQVVREIVCDGDVCTITPQKLPKPVVEIHCDGDVCTIVPRKKARTSFSHEISTKNYHEIERHLLSTLLTAVARNNTIREKCYAYIILWLGHSCAVHSVTFSSDHIPTEDIVLSDCGDGNDDDDDGPMILRKYPQLFSLNGICSETSLVVTLPRISLFPIVECAPHPLGFLVLTSDGNISIFNINLVQLSAMDTALIVPPINTSPYSLGMVLSLPTGEIIYRPHTNEVRCLGLSLAHYCVMEKERGHCSSLLSTIPFGEARISTILWKTVHPQHITSMTRMYSSFSHDAVLTRCNDTIGRLISQNDMSWLQLDVFKNDMESFKALRTLSSR